MWPRSMMTLRAAPTTSAALSTCARAAKARPISHAAAPGSADDQQHLREQRRRDRRVVGRQHPPEDPRQTGSG
jgi:hypothetical protein